MSKEPEDKPGIIPKADYRDDLEAEVAYHTARIKAGNPFRVNKKYKHIVIPDFGPDQRREKLDWQLEEIRRCKEGYDGMPGRYYFYFNHCYIKHKKRGKIRPDFRTIQLEFAKVKEEVLKTPGQGLVNIKRRQIGMSWDFSADNIYDCTFNKDFDIGMNSKGELDSQSLFVKHKYVHRNVTPFLRAMVHIDRRDAMEFHKWDKKKQQWFGTGSSIKSVAPTPTAHAGNQYRKLVIDEAGEQEDLMALWSNAEDTIMQETERVGTPFIFGTMGDTAKAGRGLMEFWLKSHLYNLRKFPIWGYNGLLMDDFGNDLIEDAVRWILYERKRKEEGSQVIYNKFVQKYPLTEDDAFLTVSGAGVGSTQLRNKRYAQLVEMPAMQVRGWMRPKAEGLPDFVPDPAGKIIVYERPKQLLNGYVASTDPAEDDDVAKTRDNSNLSTAILSRPLGLDPPKICLEYTDRPGKFADYYTQVALALQWYNNTQVLIEMNKGGFRMKDWFELYYPKLLALSPKSSQSAKQGFESRVGIKMNSDRKIQMMGLLDGYWESYWEFIPSIRFIDECRVFGADHADDDFAAAVGWSLIQLQSDKRVASALDASEKLKPHHQLQAIQAPGLGSNKTFQIVVNGTAIGQMRRRTGNPLIDRR